MPCRRMTGRPLASAARGWQSRAGSATVTATHNSPTATRIARIAHDPHPGHTSRWMERDILKKLRTSFRAGQGNDPAHGRSSDLGKDLGKPHCSKSVQHTGRHIGKLAHGGDATPYRLPVVRVLHCKFIAACDALIALSPYRLSIRLAARQRSISGSRSEFSRKVALSSQHLRFAYCNHALINRHGPRSTA